MPDVVEIRPGVNQWTFATDDRQIQEREFDHWLGWFGHDERDEPIKSNGKVWFVPRR